MSRFTISSMRTRRRGARGRAPGERRRGASGRSHKRQNQDSHVEDTLVGCFGGLRSGLHQVHLEEGPERLNYCDSLDAEDTGDEGDADQVLEELEEEGPSEEVELLRRSDLAESALVGTL